MARMMAATMAVMTKATPAQRAGETSCSSLFFEPRLELVRRVVDVDLVEAMRRLDWRVREVESSIPPDCGTLDQNTHVGGSAEGIV
jgi:hypothetical protein